MVTWKIRRSTKKAGESAGHLNKNGYIYIRVCGRNYLAHRLIWLYVHGTFPEEEIDHINRIRTDNRLVNLRLATRSINAKNRGLQSNNKTGVPGVGWHKASNKYRARIMVNNKFHHLGVFDTIEEAASARKYFINMLAAAPKGEE